MPQDTPTKTAAVWFELPVRNLDRAVAFYETILSTRMIREQLSHGMGAVFPYAEGSASGSLMEQSDHAPDTAGAIVYLDCSGRLEEVAGRVEQAGGRLLTPRVDLPNGQGSFFRIADSEGNRVGLHAAA